MFKPQQVHDEVNQLYSTGKNWQEVAESLRADANKFKLYCKFCKTICSECRIMRNRRLGELSQMVYHEFAISF